MCDKRSRYLLPGLELSFIRSSEELRKNSGILLSSNMNLDLYKHFSEH